MKKLLSQIIAGFAGLWLAILFVPDANLALFTGSSFFGFSITQDWQMLLLLGIILGLLNYFAKPIISGLTLPLRIISLGILDVIINMAMVWIVDIMFKEITILLWLPLLETTLIIWAINFVLEKILLKEKT
jgi:putative membrane protein